LMDAIAELMAIDSEADHESPNIRFRSFVLSGLNRACLQEWIAILDTEVESMDKFYQPWAFF